MLLKTFRIPKARLFGIFFPDTSKFRRYRFPVELLTHDPNTLSVQLRGSLMSKTTPRSRFVSLMIVATFLLVVGIVSLVPSSSALTNSGSVTSFGSPLTENFDTLAQTGTNIAWTDNTTIPGWYSTRPTYNSGTGSSNTGALYSFGVAGTNPVTDRALGSVGSGTTGTIYQAARLTNNTGSTITSLDISYIGEQWRNGGTSIPIPSLFNTR